jgi:hypothetical protein
MCKVMDSFPVIGGLMRKPESAFYAREIIFAFFMQFVLIVEMAIKGTQGTKSNSLCFLFRDLEKRLEGT